MNKLITGGILFFLLCFAVLALVYALSFNTQSPESDVPNINQLPMPPSTSTQPSESTSLLVSEVLNNPEKYNGKRLTIRGYYYQVYFPEGMEHRVITPKIVRDETGKPSSDTLLRDVIWVEWYSTPDEMFRSKLVCSTKAMGEFFGQVEVEGTFVIINRKPSNPNREDPLFSGGGDPYFGQSQILQLKTEKVSVYDETLNQYVPIPMKRRE